MTIEEAIKSSVLLKPGIRTVLNIIYTSRVVEDQVNEMLKPFDISMPQYNVLRILRGQKGKPANLCTLQERMISKMSNTTRLVDKLVAKNYAERSVCQKNRRKVEIIITPQGLELLEKIDPLTEANHKEILKNLTSEEMETLNNLLDKLK